MDEGRGGGAYYSHPKQTPGNRQLREADGMKLGGFIAAGLVGAAAALYVARKRPGAAAAAGSAAGELWSSLAGKAVSGILRRSTKMRELKPQARTSSSAAAASGDKRSNAAIGTSSDGEAWTQIAALVGNDPAVKRETEKILSEAGSSAQTH